MLTISANGKGIPDSMKKELFERFYSKARGTGLGLSIVGALVERYQGKVWVGNRIYNDYTKGTTFGLIFTTYCIMTCLGCINLIIPPIAIRVICYFHTIA